MCTSGAFAASCSRRFRTARIARMSLALALAAALASAAFAQADPPEDPPAEGPEAYRIAAGDTISIFVAERPDLSVNVLVPIEGRTIIPGAGAVDVSGRSVEEISAAIGMLLRARARLVAPRVAVSLISYGSRRAFVYGEVTSPRATDLPAESRVTLTQAVASSGGFNADADRTRVRITRRPKTGKLSVFVVDAQSIAEGISPESDPVLEPGDTIYVPKREPVYVLGLVRNPGAYVVPYGYPLTVSKAVALAGGWSRFGRYRRVRVIRRTDEGVKTFTIDLKAVLLDGKLDKDLELMPGDTVFVPERWL